jgi:ribosomal protein L9
VYYDDLIGGQILSPLKITPVCKNGFIDYMKSIGKLGGQNKVPRLSNDRKIADALKALEIKITSKAGGEKLFGSITNIDIAAALAKGGQEIDRKFITSGIVKRTGKYAASVRLHRDVIVELAYEIVAEKA